MQKGFFLLVLSLVSLCFSCTKEPVITDEMLDGDIIFDPSLYNPENYLVSAMYPTPSAKDLEKHIILAIHGYSSSTFEWQEFKDLDPIAVKKMVKGAIIIDGRNHLDREKWLAAGWKFRALGRTH